MSDMNMHTCPVSARRFAILKKWTRQRAQKIALGELALFKSPDLADSRSRPLESVP